MNDVLIPFNENFTGYWYQYDEETDTWSDIGIEFNFKIYNETERFQSDIINIRSGVRTYVIETSSDIDFNQKDKISVGILNNNKKYQIKEIALLRNNYASFASQEWCDVDNYSSKVLYLG